MSLGHSLLPPSSGWGCWGTSVPWHQLWQLGLVLDLSTRGRKDFSERWEQSREPWGCEGRTWGWPCRSRPCPAHAAARSTRAGSSRGPCSRWSLRSQTSHNVPSHCRKAERGCESTWHWALSKWKALTPWQVSDQTAWEVGNYCSPAPGIIVWCVQSCSLHWQGYLHILGIYSIRISFTPLQFNAKWISALHQN